jgi:putative phage-type endonuclease
MPREDWLLWRKRGIGGSDAAAVCGVSKWRGPLTVYMEKKGLLERSDPGEAAYWGTTLEDVVAKEFTKRTGLRVRKRNAMFRHPRYPWMLADVDREMVGANVGLECKTTSAYQSEQWKDDELPDEYYLQIQHYIEVMGWEACWVAVLIGGQRFLFKKVERNDALISQIVEKEREFWEEHVLKDVPPAIGFADNAAEIWPEDSDAEMVPADEIAEQLAIELEVARQEKGEAESRENALILRLQEIIGDRQGIEGIATWRKSKDAVKVDLERVMSDMARLIPDGDKVQRELMERYSILKPGSRRFLFKYKPQAQKEAA